MLISPLHSKKDKTKKNNNKRNAKYTYKTTPSSPSLALSLAVLARVRRHHPLLLGREVTLIDPVSLFHGRRRRRRWQCRSRPTTSGAGRLRVDGDSDETIET